MSRNVILKLTMEFMNPRLADINKIESILGKSKTLMTHRLQLESQYRPIQYTTVSPQTISLLRTLKSDDWKLHLPQKLIV